MIPINQRRAPIVRFATDTDGAAIAFLSLRSGREVKMLAETYEWLLSSGYSLAWTTITDRDGRQYVVVPVTKASGNLVMAARLIAGAGRNQHVKYRDRDRSNLRLDNLETVAGWARRFDAGYVPSFGFLPPTPLPLDAAAGYPAPQLVASHRLGQGSEKAPEAPCMSV